MKDEIKQNDQNCKLENKNATRIKLAIFKFTVVTKYTNKELLEPTTLINNFEYRIEISG